MKHRFTFLTVLILKRRHLPPRITRITIHLSTLMKSLLLILLTMTATVCAKDIRVLVWDEQQPQQKEGYGEKFLGETIAAHL